MGEANRRKKLDPNFGKKPKYLSLDMLKLPEAEISNKSMWEQLGNIPEDCLPEYKMDFTNLDILMAIQMNFFQELNAMRLRVKNNWSMSEFNKGRLFLFEAIAKAFEIDRLESFTDDGFGKQKYEIRKAGVMLNNSGGTKDMQDPLIWLFLPKEIHRFIDLYWDGIGEWRG